MRTINDVLQEVEDLRSTVSSAVQTITGAANDAIDAVNDKAAQMDAVCVKVTDAGGALSTFDSALSNAVYLIRQSPTGLRHVAFKVNGAPNTQYLCTSVSFTGSYVFARVEESGNGSTPSIRWYVSQDGGSTWRVYLDENYALSSDFINAPASVDAAIATAFSRAYDDNPFNNGWCKVYTFIVSSVWYKVYVFNVSNNSSNNKKSGSGRLESSDGRSWGVTLVDDVVTVAVTNSGFISTSVTNLLTSLEGEGGSYSGSTTFSAIDNILNAAEAFFTNVSLAYPGKQLRLHCTMNSADVYVTKSTGGYYCVDISEALVWYVKQSGSWVQKGIIVYGSGTGIAGTTFLTDVYIGSASSTKRLTVNGNLDVSGLITATGGLETNSRVSTGALFATSITTTGEAKANSLKINNTYTWAATGKITVNELVVGSVAGIDSSGNLTAVSSFMTSDARLKKNIKPYEYHDSILNLTVKEFDMLDDSHHIGFIAQELQQKYPELVKEREDGYLVIEESKVVYLLLEEVKRLEARVLSLECKDGHKV